MERALLALECLSMIFDEGLVDGKQFSSDVYCIAHSAPGRCGNPHVDWLTKIEEVEEHAKKHNIYDAEKILTKEPRFNNPYEEIAE